VVLEPAWGGHQEADPVPEARLLRLLFLSANDEAWDDAGGPLEHLDHDTMNLESQLASRGNKESEGAHRARHPERK